MTLWASIFVLPSLTRVTSQKSVLISLKEEVTFFWKSFHFRQKFSRVVILRSRIDWYWRVTCQTIDITNTYIELKDKGMNNQPMTPCNNKAKGQTIVRLTPILGQDSWLLGNYGDGQRRKIVRFRVISLKITHNTNTFCKGSGRRKYWIFPRDITPRPNI